jgi:tetratricopeptide (TPR) repeat protein
MKNLILLIILSFASSVVFCQSTDSAQFYFKKGITEKDAKLYAVAAKSFDKAISINPKLADAYIENGNVNMQMSRTDAAMYNYTKAYELQPENEEVIQQLTTMYFNYRMFQKAIDLVQKCSNCTNTDKILGISYYNLEDYGKAKKYLLKAVAEDKTDGEVAYTLGHTYLELEDEKDAIQQYENAVADEPDRDVWLYELGLIYYNQDDYKGALRYMQLASEKGYPKSNDYYENLGFAQLYSGDKDQGLKTLSIVMDHKPNNKELLNNIAYAMYDTKQYDDALNYFAKLLELDPKDASSLYMAGIIFQKKGDKEKGERLCDKAIEMDPSLAKNRHKTGSSIGL